MFLRLILNNFYKYKYTNNLNNSINNNVNNNYDAYIEFSKLYSQI